MDKTFVNNVGEKIKTFAKVFLIAGIAATVIACIVIPCVMGFYDGSFVVCVITVTGSLLVFPISFFILYGFGQLIPIRVNAKNTCTFLPPAKRRKIHPLTPVPKPLQQHRQSLPEPELPHPFPPARSAQSVAGITQVMPKSVSIATTVFDREIIRKQQELMHIWETQEFVSLPPLE